MPSEDERRKENFLHDLRSGVPHQELMKKYRLTPRGFDTLSRNVLHLPGADAEPRLRSRRHLEFLLPISESQHPENTGFVYDISDDGVGVRGLKTKVHDLKTFVIPADDFFRIEPVVFQGLCRWIEEKENRWESAAGFKVVRVLSGSLTELQDILRALNPESTRD
ncbi:MAG: hypothetical protein LDL33_09665 [Desulfomonile sp.]|nr:hypothetical protein [Desulfomonile sp.]